jgi:hypothetical protein
MYGIAVCLRARPGMASSCGKWSETNSQYTQEYQCHEACAPPPIENVSECGPKGQ